MLAMHRDKPRAIGKTIIGAAADLGLHFRVDDTRGDARDAQARRFVAHDTTCVMIERGLGCAVHAPSGVRLAAGTARDVEDASVIADGELTLAERVLAGDESLANDIYEGEVSLVLEKVPYPAIEPVDPQWVALLRERIAGLINAETHAETAERHLHLHDLFSESTPASGVEAARQLREVGVITREQMFLLIDAAIEGLVNEAIVADRVASRLERKRELGEPTEFEEQVYMRRYYQLRAYYLRRLGEHEMAELLRRDPEEYQRIIDEAPPSEWMASLLRNAGL
jgi:hypothetical protein